MSGEPKVAIITGASPGIGAGRVTGFRECGSRVVAHSRSIRPDAFGDPDVLPVDGDSADPRTAERVVGGALDRFGRVDPLVNNAGAFRSKPLVDSTEVDFSSLVSVNLAGFFQIAPRAVAFMRRHGRGPIVNITTRLVDQPLAAVPAAMAALTKGGFAAGTRSLAIACANRGVRGHAVAPGIIKTPRHPAANHEFLAGLHPLHRRGEIREVVEAVLDRESAAFVTGEVVPVDGGQHAGRW